jgi:hypothetical protein
MGQLVSIFWANLTAFSLQHSMMYPLPELASKCGCHRMLDLAVGRLDHRRSAQAMLTNDVSTMRWEFSGLLSSKRLAFSIQAF